MKCNALHLMLIVAAVSCNDHSIQVKDKEDSINLISPATPETSYVIPDTVEKEQKSPKGIYGVKIPCVGCKETEHTIEFLPDHRYHFEESIPGKTKQVVIKKGLWKQEGNKIILYRGDQIEAVYFWQGESLFLQQSGGENLPMTLLPSAANNKVLQGKKKTGNEYFGVGNEPFWNIEINSKSEIIFRLADWTEPKTFPLGTKKLFSNSTVYTGALNTENIRVSIFNTFCSDGMSENIYNSRISVLLNDTLYQGCGIYFK